MRDLKAFALGLFLTLASFTGAFAQCGTTAPANKFCGNDTGSSALATYKSIPAGALTPIAGGTVLGNPTGALAVPIATTAPVLGIPGTSTGQVGLAGATGGTAILRAQATAGSAVSLLPTAAGTLVGTATSPLAIDAVTGQASITGLSGGVLAGAGPAFTRTPVLGSSGTLGSLGFGNATSGIVTVQPVAGALGTVTISLPAAAGTFAVSATSPLVLGATSGALTCPTCVTSSGGGAITGTAPISVSAAGVVSITSPLPLTNGGTNASLTASNGGIVWSNGTQLQILAGTAIARLPVLSGATATPVFGAYTLPASVTSGGIPFFSSTTAQGSSGLLAANAIMLGGGAGVAPATLASLGTTTTVLHGNAAGPPTFSAIALGADVSGILPVVNGGTGGATALAARTNLGVRGILIANITIFVNASSVSTANCNGSTCQPGSLANDCLSIAAPCLTLQQATNVALALDNNSFAITVQLSDGTYTTGTIIDGALVGGGRAQAGGAAVYPITFQGNSSTPTNVIVSTVTGPCFQADHYAYIQVINLLAKCVYDFNALNYGQIYVNGGVTTDSVAVAGSQHYYATFYGSIRIDGANFYKNTGGTGTPDTLFQSTHQGNIRFGVAASATLTATSNVTFAVATAYALTSADITVTGGATFAAGGFTITGPCWKIEDASIQWAGGSGVCNNANGFPGTVAGLINGGFGDFYTTGAWCTPSVSVFASGTNATYTTPSCRGQLARYLVIEGVGGGGGGAGSGTTPGAATAGGNTCWNTAGTACTTPVYQMGGGALGSVSAGTAAAGGAVSGSGTCDDSQPGGSGAGGANQLNQFGASGGVSRYGGAGPGQFAGAGIAAATNSGSGGGGAGDSTNINSGGGGGAGAWCQVQIVTPAATYTYTVPATAAGGTAGTGGSAGGVGAAGKLKVIAYWN